MTWLDEVTKTFAAAGPYVNAGVWVVLLAMLVYLTAVIGAKLRWYRRARQQAREMRKRLDAIQITGELNADTAFALLLGSNKETRGAVEYSPARRMVEEVRDSLRMWNHGVLDPDAAAPVIDAAVMEEMLDRERHLPALGTIASAAPFIGLLGTVLGLVPALGSLGSMQVQQIASSVSEPLMATALGLLVAIPGSVGYNMLLAEHRQLEVDTVAFGKRLVTFIERARHGRPRAGGPGPGPPAPPRI